MSRHRDRRGRFTRRSSHRRRRSTRSARSTSHASTPTASSRGGFMGISPMIWIALAGGAAFLWWSRSKVSVPQIPQLPQVPSGSALRIPQISPVPISASPQPSEIVPSGNVPGSIWV